MRVRGHRGERFPVQAEFALRAGASNRDLMHAVPTYPRGGGWGWGASDIEFPEAAAAGRPICVSNLPVQSVVHGSNSLEALGERAPNPIAFRENAERKRRPEPKPSGRTLLPAPRCEHHDHDDDHGREQQRRDDGEDHELAQADAHEAYSAPPSTSAGVLRALGGARSDGDRNCHTARKIPKATTSARKPPPTATAGTHVGTRESGGWPARNRVFSVSSSATRASSSPIRACAVSSSPRKGSPTRPSVARPPRAQEVA